MSRRRAEATPRISAADAAPATSDDGDTSPLPARKSARPSSSREDSWNLESLASTFAGRRAAPSAWAPPFKVAFYILCAVRLWSAIVNTIADCDETFNYWEPAHYLLYGTGLQTWEYSPNYALRTYFYVGLHWLLGRIAGVFVGLDNKVAVFQYVRCALGLWSAFCESLLYLGAKIRFGNRTANYLLVLLTSSPGMFAASTALLPSSFAMYCFAAAWGAWMHRAYPLAVFCVAAGALVGWPFSALVGVPLALDVARRAGLVELANWSLFSGAMLVVPMALADRWAYGYWTMPTWNIVRYNVFGNTGGSELYGVEPWNFYIRNLFLNFNLAAGLAGLSLPLLIASCSWKRDRPGFVQACFYLLPLYIWVLFMSSKPHKEERFIFPVYPVICFAAAFSTSLLHAFLSCLFGIPSAEPEPVAAAGGAAAVAARVAARRAAPPRLKAPGGWRVVAVRLLVALLLACIFILGIARTSGTIINYRAPMAVYRHLSEQEVPAAPQGPLRVCVGKEWYRFPSSFFLPPGASLEFLRSGFKGQLPRAYEPWPNGTAADVARHFNDRNAEDPARYVPPSSCHFIVDLELPSDGDDWRRAGGPWRVAFAAPFLHAARSPGLARAFYVPGLSPRTNAFVRYVLLRNEALLPSRDSNAGAGSGTGAAGPSRGDVD
eukprot:tig00021043_g17621.t1